eukprot:m.96968 g.96968  ORF g.96968 m.96968 type:complete len:168 (-) comp8810_c0_seq1:511-1014(-)
MDAPGYYNSSDPEWDFLRPDESEQDSTTIAWQIRNATVSNELRLNYSTPLFLGSPGNAYVSARGAGETIFIAREKGAGREPHVDYSCFNVWSAQLVGRKRWRFRAPRASDGILWQDIVYHGATPEFELDSAPELEAILEPGDVVVWYVFSHPPDEHNRQTDRQISTG